FNRKPARSKLVDVLEHNDSGLHGHPEQCQETYAGGNAEVGAGDEKSKQAANRRDGDISHNQQRPFEGFEHRVQEYENDEDSNGKHDEQSLVGSFLAGVFALPM